MKAANLLGLGCSVLGAHWHHKTFMQRGANERAESALSRDRPGRRDVPGRGGRGASAGGGRRAAAKVNATEAVTD